MQMKLTRQQFSKISIKLEKLFITKSFTVTLEYANEFFNRVKD